MNDADVAAVAAVADEPQIARFTSVPSPYSETDARAWLTVTRAGLRAGTDLHPLIVDAETDEVLGACGLSARSRDPNTWEAGYWVGVAHRGRGLAGRAIRLITRFAFDELGAQRLEILAEEVNPGSTRTALGCGFTREGVLRSYLEIGGARRDIVVHSLLPGELAGESSQAP